MPSSRSMSLQHLAEGILHPEAEGQPGEEAFGFLLRNFLDGYYSAKKDEKRRLLQKEPPKIRQILHDQGVVDAYLAALAIYLSCLDGLPQPTWALQKWRMPDKPWFSLSSPEARMWLITESPGPFRERHLFISADALTRA